MVQVWCCVYQYLLLLPGLSKILSKKDAGIIVPCLALDLLIFNKISHAQSLWVSDHHS